MRARYYLAQNVSVKEVAAAFCVERLMDAFAMLALASLLIYAFPGYLGILWLVMLGVGCGLILLIVLPWKGLASYAAAFRPSCDLITRPFVWLARTLDSAEKLVRPRGVIIGFLAGFAAWCLEGIGLVVIGWMFSSAVIDPMVVVGIYATAALIGALSFLPGGLGSTETVMAALLVAMGHSLGDAAIMVLACRIATLWFGILLGWLAVAVLGGWRQGASKGRGDRD